MPLPPYWEVDSGRGPRTAAVAVTPGAASLIEALRLLSPAVRSKMISEVGKALDDEDITGVTVVALLSELAK